MVIRRSIVSVGIGGNVSLGLGALNDEICEQLILKY